MKRIALFVDGSNFMSACNLVGLRPDYDKLVKFFARDGDVVGAFYFTAMLPKDVPNTLRPLTDRLSYNGWTLVSKEVKTYHDASGEAKTKGNMDAEMIVHGFKMCEHITDLVLFSGDNDFRSAVEEWQVRGMRTTAVSVLSREQGQSMMGDDLRRQVNRFIDLKDIQAEITLELDTKPEGPKIEFLRRKRP